MPDGESPHTAMPQILESRQGCPVLAQRRSQQCVATGYNVVGRETRYDRIWHHSIVVDTDLLDARHARPTSEGATDHRHRCVPDIKSLSHKRHLIWSMLSSRL
jgi:hypothetical protein